MRTALRRLFAALLVILSGTVAVLVFLLVSTLPKTEGQVSVAGLSAAVTVDRDTDGIPRIRADSWEDAFFALGFVHAQDRFFQMEMTRRFGAGRLSELVGPGAFAIDRQMRTLGLHRLAQAQVDRAGPAFRARIETYVAGVNAWLTEESFPHVPEFLALGLTPEPWSAADSMVWGKLMALRLSSNWRQELAFTEIAEKLGADAIDVLFPGAPKAGPVSSVPSPIPGVTAWPGATVWTDLLTPTDVPRQASNAWVLAPSRSSTGTPVLANDPHLGFQAPILWYLARLETPEGMLAGATVPGVPLMIAGQNDHVAWGFTTTGGDVEDLFIERIVDRDGALAQARADGARPLAVRRETISVKGEEPRELEIFTTSNGPLMPWLNGDDTEVRTGQAYYALRAPYLEADDATAEALYGLNMARNVDDVLSALASFHSPQQNVFFAGRDGRIGYVSAGRVPVRGIANRDAPRDGTRPEFDWQGYLPFSALPAVIDPKEGHAQNANEQVGRPGQTDLIARHWPDRHRGDRLSERLNDRETWGLGDSLDLQKDSVTPVFGLVTRAMAAYLPPGTAAQMGTAWGSWDADVTRDSRPALVFNLFLDQLKRAIFADELADGFDRWRGPRVTAILGVIDGPHEGWCNDVRTTAEEDCAAAINQAWDATQTRLAEIDATLGREALWGDFHIARFRHPVLSRIPVLKNWFTPEVPTDGDYPTLDRGAARTTDDDRLFEHVHGAGMRMVLDVANPEQSMFMTATGQSGNPFSPHYDDLMDRWAEGGYLHLTRNVDDPPARRLLLEPRD